MARRKCRSVPQIPQAVTRTNTCPICGVGIGVSRSSN